MNESRTNRILRALLRAAKAAPELDAAKAELGFETRLLASIRARRAVEESPWLLWNRLVWRAVPTIAAVVLLLACVEWFGQPSDASFASWSDPLGFEQMLTQELGGWR
jgi:hypothetical protein